MGLFFGRKNNNEEIPEDFVLYEADEDEDDYDEVEEVYSDEDDYDEVEEFYPDEDDYDEAEEVYSDEDESLEDQNTRKISLDEVELMLNEDEEDEEYEEIELSFFGRLIHNRVFVLVAGCIVAAAILAGAAYGVVNYLNPLRSYAQVMASKENVLRTMDVESTLESGNRYNITSLVAGKIITSKYEVGDTVKSGDVLYKIDDTDAKLALERAKNELDKASDPTTGVKSSTARIVATEAGVIKTLTIKAGSSISAGSQIGTVLKSDGTVAPLISYVSGKVSVVSVNEGRTVSIGQVIASLEAKEGGTSESDRKYDKKSGEIDVQSAQRHLDNYSIKSPVAGVIAEKNYRVGDNVGITDPDNPMMVIIDTSTLTFKFSVDEFKVREIKKGLEVIVTTDSMPDETFLGKVSYVSTEGVADENGNPLYEVGVVIDEPGNLKAGMNIKAKVVLASAKKVVAVPEKALLKSDGQNALILVKNDEFSEGVDDWIDESLENELQNPEIKVPDGCSLISVRYGISDGLITEVISGVDVGDTIVYDPDTENNFVVATGDNKKAAKDVDESDVGRGVSDYSTEEKASDREKAEAAVDKKIKAAIGDVGGLEKEEKLSTY